MAGLARWANKGADSFFLFMPLAGPLTSALPTKWWKLLLTDHMGDSCAVVSPGLRRGTRSTRSKVASHTVFS